MPVISEGYSRQGQEKKENCINIYEKYFEKSKNLTSRVGKLLKGKLCWPLMVKVGKLKVKSELLNDCGHIKLIDG